MTKAVHTEILETRNRKSIPFNRMPQGFRIGYTDFEIRAVAQQTYRLWHRIIRHASRSSGRPTQWFPP